MPEPGVVLLTTYEPPVIADLDIATVNPSLWTWFTASPAIVVRLADGVAEEVLHRLDTLVAIALISLWWPL